MTELVERIDPNRIAQVIEAGINAYLLSFARLPGARSQDEGPIVWVDSGVPDETFNSIVRADLGPEEVDGAIEAALGHFRERSRLVTWHIGPSTRPADLDRSLPAHGMEHLEDEPGMAVELERIPADLPLPPELAVEEVGDRAGLEEWVGVWLFGAPPEVRRLYLDTLYMRGVGGDLPWCYYLGRLDGRPVAISELFVGEGVAGVHYVVTLPECRRRGYGAAMTLQALRAAHALGYRVAVLTSSPDGLGVYRRLGFREYCWFRRYH